MIATLRQRNFFLLWFAGLISYTGNWMLGVARPIIVYQMTGSTIATGGIVLASMLPSILLSSFAGVFVDRWERKRTMVIVNVLLGLSLIPLTFVRSADQLWLFYVVTFVQATLVQFFAPAENAMLPLLVDEQHLVSANALNSLNNNLARLIGPAIGGILLSAAGLSAVVLVDSATYWIAAALILLISVTSRPTPTTDPVPGGVTRLARDWRAGLRVIQTDPLLKLLFVCAAIMALGEGAVGVLFVPFVTDVLRGEATFLGWLMSAQAVGGLIGGVVISWVGPRTTPLRLFIFGSLIFGTIDLMIFNFTAAAPGLALLLFVIVGIPTVGIGTGYDTLVQLRTVDAYRGRVFGAIQTVMALFAIVGTGIASVLGEVIGAWPTINLQGSNYVVVGLLMLFALRVGWVAARPVSTAAD